MDKGLAHLYFISLIIAALVSVYGAWFRKDWAKTNYERGFPPGPKNFRAYIWTFRIFSIFALFMIITLYVLVLTDR